MGIIGRYCLALIYGIILFAFVVNFSFAKPQGGVATYGNVTINQNPGNNISTLITQTSQKGIIDWQSFSIAEYERVHFAQPNAVAITLNRVLGGDVSNIFGKLTATGQVFIINPSGILFGPNAVIDVAGLIATTANISNEDFLQDKYFFFQGPNNSAKIINQGYIKVRDGGLVALVAPSVKNLGIIEANLGKVILGSTSATSTFVIDFYGDELINFTIPTDTNENTDTPVVQSGKIIAHGGRVLLTANSAKNIVDRAINMSGIIEADTVGMQAGSVVLHGGVKGEVAVTGKITARGNQAGESGGTVKITGEKSGLFSGAVIDVSGKKGGGKVLIGADYQDGVLIPAAEMTYIDEGATILANALEFGNGGRVIVWSNGSTRFYGTVEAKGGPEGGSGGFLETSGNWLDVNYGIADLTALNGTIGTWLIDPYDIYIINGSPPSGADWYNILGVWDYIPPANNSILFDSSILAKLALADVFISTVNILGTQAGNITFGSGATINYVGSQRSLTIFAENDIILGAGTVISGNLNLSLLALGAGDNITISGATISGNNLVSTVIAGSNITISNATISGNGLASTLGAGNNIAINNATTISGNLTFSLAAGNNITISSGATISGNNLILSLAADNNITVSNATISGNSLVSTLGAGTNIAINNGTTISGSNLVLSLGAGNNITINSGATIIGNNLVSTLGAGNNIAINSGATISGANLVLSLVAGGVVTINAPLSVGTFEVLGGALRFNVASSPAVFTTTLQTYATPVTLLKDTTLTSNGVIIFANTVTGLFDLTIYASNVAFADTINGPFDLTISSSNVAFASNIGSVTPLSSIAIDAANILLNSSKVQTTGPQTYNGHLILSNNVSLTAGGSLIFSNGIISPFGLTLNVGNGNILFSGSSVGIYLLPLGTLEIINANNVTSEVPIFTRSFSQRGGTGTTSFSLLFVGAGGFGTYVPGSGNGLATIITRNVLGNIDARGLALSTEAADLNGYLNGRLAPGGIQNILILNAILPDTHFWGGIDIFPFMNGLMSVTNSAVDEISDKLQEEMDPWLKDITSADQNSETLSFGTSDNAGYLSVLSPFIDCK